MSQRLIAALVASGLVAVLFGAALVEPMPYTIFAPGPTLDVLGTTNGQEIIQVSGHKTYRDDGQLRMTTVSVSQEDATRNLFEVVGAWLDHNDAVYPHDVIYPGGQTAEESQTEGQVQMVSSQDTAVAVAERELGFHVTDAIEVQYISPGSPADGALAVRDIFLTVNGAPITSGDQLVKAINDTPSGQALTIGVRRDGKDETVHVTPRTIDGKQRIGVELGGGFIFPFDVSVDIDPNISGPSAGLMFSLAIYDTLTPGSLTGGQTVAGTGEINPDGSVGPIGGIQQKVIGARDAGARLFLVPPDNCTDVKGARNGEMRLVKAPTMHSAVQSIQAWVKNPDATLPSCAKS